MNNAAELAFKELQAERRQLRKELDETKFQLDLANEAARVTRDAAWPSAEDMDVCSNKVYSCTSELNICKTDKRTLAIELSQISYAMEDVTGNLPSCLSLHPHLHLSLFLDIYHIIPLILCPSVAHSKRRATSVPPT